MPKLSWLLAGGIVCGLLAASLPASFAQPGLAPERRPAAKDQSAPGAERRPADNGRPAQEPDRRVTELTPTSRPALLDVGSPAPPIRAASWINGGGLQVTEPGKPAVFVLTFWASWSGPARAAMEELGNLYGPFRARGVVFLAVTDEPAEAARSFFNASKVPTCPTAIDDDGATTRAYCEAAGVNFVPYTFIIGPNRTIAWHGHPQQPELAQTLEELLSGRYDAAVTRERVRKSRSLEHLETLFRDACGNQAWQTALLALDSLLSTDAPKPRLLRYKLSILLGEMDDLDLARALADKLLRDYATDFRFLNSAAWDVLSDPRLYVRDPSIGFKLARAAYQASKGSDAAVADTYARALHLIGRTDLAIRVQTHAVELGTPEQRPGYERMLAFYRACQGLQGEATADAK